MKTVLEIFREITKIPHCSFKTKKMAKYIKKFAKKEGFKIEIDNAKNILCYKKNRKIALQSHYDMVCMGNAPKIEILEANDTLTAKNSSLGADNGIGVAMMLYFMQIYDNFEALFTNDEEVGLIGVNNLNLKLKAKKLINLDSEDEKAIFIGCAGGLEIDGFKNFKKKSIGEGYQFYKIEVTGLKGGHSGFDIDKNIKSSIKVLSSFLSNKRLKLIEFNGGEKMNSIPRFAYAIVASMEILTAIPNIKITKLDKNYDFYIKDFKKILRFLNSCKQGVINFDNRFGIPKDSINLAIVKINSKIQMKFFVRSLTNKGLEELKNHITTLLKLENYDIKYPTQFASWKPEITKFAKKIRKMAKQFFPDNHFKAVHAGFECGVLKEFFPKLKIVSIGPNIHYPHSTRELCELKSVKKVSKLLNVILKKQ